MAGAILSHNRLALQTICNFLYVLKAHYQELIMVDGLPARYKQASGINIFTSSGPRFSSACLLGIILSRSSHRVSQHCRKEPALFRRRLSAEGAKPESNKRWKTGSGHDCKYVMYVKYVKYVCGFSRISHDSKLLVKPKWYHSAVPERLTWLLFFGDTIRFFLVSNCRIISPTDRWSILCAGPGLADAGWNAVSSESLRAESIFLPFLHRSL